MSPLHNQRHIAMSRICYDRSRSLGMTHNWSLILPTLPVMARHLTLSEDFLSTVFKLTSHRDSERRF